MQPQERRAALRSATQPLHQELDELGSNLDLRRRDDYCKYLLANAGPIIGLELALETSGVEERFADWPSRRRRFSLAVDLHALQLTARPARTREQFSTSAMLGVLYVLEGSRLGAQLLHKRASESRDEGVLAARSFLRSHDAGLWRSFLRALEEPHDTLDAEEMTEAACYTFSLFKDAFAMYCAPAAPLTRSNPQLLASPALS